MGCGGFEEWVFGNFRDECGGMLKSMWVATLGRSGLGIARSGLAWLELGTEQDGGDDDEDGLEQGRGSDRRGCS